MCSERWRVVFRGKEKPVSGLISAVSEKQVQVLEGATNKPPLGRGLREVLHSVELPVGVARIRGKCNM